MPEQHIVEHHVDSAILSAQSCIALLRDRRFDAKGGRPPFIPFARATWGGGAIFGKNQ